MEKSKTNELKKLILDEIKLREEFRRTRDELEKLVNPISSHVKQCCKWWETNLPNTTEVIITMDNGTTIKLTKPKEEVCSVESYLPFGIDFIECQLIIL